MDSVDSPCQLIVSKDVQVKIAGVASDPLQIRFDNSRVMGTRRTLVANADLNGCRDHGALFCFDYVGDDPQKAELLSYKWNRLPVKQNKPGTVVQASIPYQRNKPANNRQTSTVISSQARDPKIVFESTTVVSHDRTNQALPAAHILDIISPTSPSQRTLEHKNLDSTLKIVRQHENSDASSKDIKQTKLSPSDRLFEDFSSRLESAAVDPSKSPETVKINSLLQSNILSEKRKSQYSKLIGEKGVLKSNPGNVTAADASSQTNKQHREARSNLRSSTQIKSPSPQQKLNQSKPVDTQSPRQSKASQMEATNSTAPVCHLSKRANIGLLGKDLLKDGLTSDNNATQSPKPKYTATFDDPSTQDNKVLKDLQNQMKEKYLTSVPGAKKAYQGSEKSSTTENDSRGYLISDRYPSSQKAATERRGLTTERPNISNSNNAQEDNLDRSYLLKNLKLLEKEISLLQSKSSINRQEEDYLYQVYGRLSDVQNRLSLIEPAQDLVEEMELSHFLDRKKDSKCFGQADSHSPKFTTPDDSEPRKRSPHPKQYAPITVYRHARLDASSDPTENSELKGNLFSKKSSKGSRGAVPDNKTSKNSKVAHQDTTSDFYEKQMTRDKLRQARIEAKRHAKSKAEMRNCTFMPQVKRQKTVTEA